MVIYQVGDSGFWVKEIQIDLLLYILQNIIKTEERIIDVPVLQIGIQVKLTKLVFRLCKQVEVGLQCIIPGILEIGWNISALLRPFDIVIMRTLETVVSTAQN